MSSECSKDITDETGDELKSPPIKKGKSLPTFCKNIFARCLRYNA